MVKMEPLVGALSLLLLLSFINICVGDTSPETLIVFKDGNTRVTNIPYEKQPAQDAPYAFTAPAFVSGLVNNEEFLAIFSTAKWSSSTSTNYMGAVVKSCYKKDYKDWGYARALIYSSTVNPPYDLWGDITAVMKDRKVYVLTTTWDPTQRVTKEQMGNILRDPFMSVASITNTVTPSGTSHSYIGGWSIQSIKDQLPITIHGTKGSNFIGGTGNGIVTTNGTIMLPIVMFRDKDMIASTLYSIDDGKTWSIGGATESDTISGSVVEWSDGKLLFAASSGSGYRKVFESNDMGVTWKKSPVLFGVWGNNLNHNNIGNQGSAIAVPVDKMNVLLFAHTMVEKKDTSYFDNLQLWLSDGQRIMCLGTISHKKKEDKNSGNSILGYVNEHLYITQRMNPLGNGQQVTSGTQKDSSAIGVTPLPHFLKNVQTAVRNWRQLDKSYQSVGISTDGLVGVLGNTKTEDNSVWADVYNCVNATVNHATSVDGGFRFDGKAGSGAKWPVQSQGENQLYKFTENAFTLTANITIHSTSEYGDISLIGASLSTDQKSVLIGLGHTKDNKWYIMQKDGDNINTEVPVEIDKEFEVAITFANGQGAVYVNGVNIAKKNIPVINTMSIDYFFIGDTGLSSKSANGHSFTVKNVMLFSRALKESEIAQFGKIKTGNALGSAAGSLSSLLSKSADGTNGAPLSLSAVACMCFVCALISMTVF